MEFKILCFEVEAGRNDVCFFFFACELKLTFSHNNISVNKFETGFIKCFTFFTYITSSVFNFSYLVCVFSLYICYKELYTFENYDTTLIFLVVGSRARIEPMLSIHRSTSSPSV